jgi:glycosyltransferase involved in cell wall biosynthesis
MKYIFCYTVNQSSVSLYFQTLCNALSERGHNVTVITDRKIKDRHFLKQSVKMLDWPSKRPVKIADMRFLYRLLKSLRPDVICANFGSVNTSMIIGFLCRIRVRIAWYHTVTEQIKIDNGDSFYYRTLRFRKRFIYLLATKIFTNSDYSIKDCMREYGVPLGKIQKTSLLIKPPADTGREKVANQICFIGRLDKSKGQQDMILALPKIVAEFNNTKVLFLGDGNNKTCLQDLAQSANVAEYCDFKGSVPLADVYKILASSCISVSASRNEAFGLVNAESIAVGTPVITTGVGGIPEIIKDGINGFHYTPGNCEQLADLVIKIFKDEKLRIKLSENSIDFFNDTFSLEKSMNKTAAIYESL